MKTEAEIRKFIKEIPIQVRKMSYQELVNQCNEYFPQIPILPLKFNNEPFFFGQHEFSGRNAICRGREITNPQNKLHENISDISFIPNDKLNKIKEFGRANKKGESMFYGALHFPTTCIEIFSKGIEFGNIQSGKMATVGTWIIREPLQIVQLPISKKYWNLLKDTVTFTLDKNSNEKIEEENRIIKELVKKDLDFEILQLFSDAFANFQIECEQDYYLSNYYKDRIFNQVPGFRVPQKFDAILYASVSNSYESDNIVIKPEAVTAKMTFMDAMQIWTVFPKEYNGPVQFIPLRQRIYADEKGKFK